MNRSTILIGFIGALALFFVLSLVVNFQGNSSTPSTPPSIPFLPQPENPLNQVHETGLFPSVSAQEYQYVYQQQERETLTVTGTKTISVEPNKVIVSVGVETENTSALQSQQENATVMAAVRNALINSGIAAEDITTTQFSIYPVWQYNISTKGRDLVGYKTTHLLRVSSRDTQKAGSIIDVASGAGANIVRGVSFSLAPETRQQFRAQALEQAAQDAKAKADSIARGLGVQVIKVNQATEVSSRVTPRYYSQRLAEASDNAPTEITPGDVDVSASIKVVFEIT